jgi:glycopeptide antibiotics resistance protein
MIESEVVFYTLSIVIVVWVFWLGWTKRGNPLRVLLLLPAVYYLTVLTGEMIFPIPEPGSCGRMSVWEFDYNFIPFNFGNAIYPGSFSDPLVQFGLNILAMIPAGIFVFMYFKSLRKWKWQVILMGGVSIEVLQFLISLGIHCPFRTIDINDVIANGLGFLIGYGIFAVLRWWVNTWLIERFSTGPILIRWAMDLFV